ncbi:hypothetical protein GCM10027062_45820 [Nocardioides hungaricus]
MSHEAGLKQALDDLAQAAPSTAPPSIATMRRRGDAMRRRRRSAAAAAGVLVACGVLGAVLQAVDRGDTDTALDASRDVSETSPTPEPAEIPCATSDRAKQWCPLGELGQATWREISEAFSGKVVPQRGVESELGQGAELPATTRVLTFEGVFKSDADWRPSPRLRVAVYVLPTAVATEPSIELRGGFSADFENGEGLATITQSDGTIIDIRFWGAQDPAGSGQVDQPTIDIFRTGLNRLAYGSPGQS